MVAIVDTNIAVANTEDGEEQISFEVKKHVGRLYQLDMLSERPAD